MALYSSLVVSPLFALACRTSVIVLYRIALMRQTDESEMFDTHFFSFALFPAEKSQERVSLSVASTQEIFPVVPSLRLYFVDQFQHGQHRLECFEIPASRPFE